MFRSVAGSIGTNACQNAKIDDGMAFSMTCVETLLLFS